MADTAVPAAQPAADSEESRSRAFDRIVSKWPPLAAVIGLLLAWHAIIIGFEVPTYMAPGPLDVMHLKGVGPKRTRKLWRELGVTTVASGTISAM